MNTSPLATNQLPRIIQGGMGIGVSHWHLARTVSQLGHLGVVSGTSLDNVLVRRLQQGDPGGHMMRAMRYFPQSRTAERVAAAYYVPGGIQKNTRYKAAPMARLEISENHINLLALANFVEVFLAKEGHDGIVGVNLMEKIQIPTLAALYGAMLAKVDFVLMGAGIPNNIPGAMDQLALGEPMTLKIDVAGAPSGSSYNVSFDPQTFWEGIPPVLKRPEFLPIVSSATLALNLSRKANGRITGFVIEGSSAGGHNAPPRGPMKLNERGEPIYGPRDEPDLERFRELGYPFWLAGSYGGRGALDRAMQLGATGIQVGTPFAFCDESAVDPSIKRQVLEQVRIGQTEVHTDPLASPTGFPFKVVGADDTVASPETYELRPRVCDIGLLRQPYLRPDGTVGYRCASEPVDDYIRKGGAIEDTEGRKCICNGLFSTVGLGQTDSDGHMEPPIVTAGDSLANLAIFLNSDSLSYSAAHVIQVLTSPQLVDEQATTESLGTKTV